MADFIGWQRVAYISDNGHSDFPETLRVYSGRKWSICDGELGRIVARGETGASTLCLWILMDRKVLMRGADRTADKGLQTLPTTWRPRRRNSPDNTIILLVSVLDHRSRI